MDRAAVALATSSAEDAGPLSSLTVVGSSILAGVGLFGVIYWLVTLHWFYFASVVPLGMGTYLLLSRAIGPEGA